jgi:hypothetical protein
MKIQHAVVGFLNRYKLNKKYIRKRESGMALT